MRRSPAFALVLALALASPAFLAAAVAAPGTNGAFTLGGAR